MKTPESIEFTRIKSDVYGNPRYVCRFLHLLTDAENGYHNGTEYIEPTLNTGEGYAVAVKRANKIGGRKYHTKSYGGGIVFQSYNIEETAKQICELVNESK